MCRPHEAAQRQLQPTASTPTNADPAAATGLNTHTDGTEHTNCCTNQSARTTARRLTHVVQPPSQRPPPLQAAAAAELPRPRAPTRCRRATFAAARVPEKRCKEPLTGAQHRPPASYNAALPPPAAKGARLPAPAADCLHQAFKTPADRQRGSYTARVDSQVSATANVTGSRRHPPDATNPKADTSRGAACKHTELRGRQAQGMKRARRDPESASCRIPPADTQASKGTARPRTAHRCRSMHARTPAQRTAQTCTPTPLQPPSRTRQFRQGTNTTEPAAINPGQHLPAC